MWCDFSTFALPTLMEVETVTIDIAGLYFNNSLSYYESEGLHNKPSPISFM